MTSDEYKKLLHLEAKVNELEIMTQKICIALASRGNRKLDPNDLHIAEFERSKLEYKGERYVAEFRARMRYQELQNEMRMLQEDYPNVGGTNGT